ncbi:MAG: hypothetical protein ACHQD8_00455 [Chitinophagales bacterium]
MKKSFTKISIYCSIFLLLAGAAKAQMADSSADTEFKPHGKLWGYAFGDYAYKGSGDTLGSAAGTQNGGRGGSNQYTKVAPNTNFFQFRRVYLGYNYEISRRFVAEFLLAAEDNWGGGVVPGTGDVLANNKLAPYLKLANIRWKNIWHGTDLVVGQAPTPTFAQGSALKDYSRNSQTSEEVWGYRSIERTIADTRRTGSFDFGATLQGWFDNRGDFGYDVMVGNGTGAKAETDQYKWFYFNVYAKFMHKKLIVDLYQDYEKIDWGVWAPGAKTGVESPNGFRYHDRNMAKLYIAYTVPKLTIGFEGFMNTMLGDVVVTGLDKNTYYRTSKATGLSLFVKGRITKEQWGFFARFDNYDPSGNLSNVVSDKNIKSYTASTSQYEPTTKEMFSTFGIDYTPFKNVHIMPNVWLNTYQSALDVNGKNAAGTTYKSMNSNITGVKGTDAVYRLTFYYVYGK